MIVSSFVTGNTTFTVLRSASRNRQLFR